MISPPTYIKLPREIISYILRIKYHQAWKNLFLPALHRKISPAVVPEDITYDDGWDQDSYLHICYGRDEPISETYSKKYIAITLSLGIESETDEEDGEHYNHHDTDIEIVCTKCYPYIYVQHEGYDCRHCDNEILWDDHYDEAANEVRCLGWYPNEGEPYRFKSYISFTVPLWRKQHGRWLLY
jgi:hypothetical protein